VPGFVPASTGRAVAGTKVYTLPEALRTRQWYQLTAILALNVTCGIGFISQAADAEVDVRRPDSCPIFVYKFRTRPRVLPASTCGCTSTCDEVTSRCSQQPVANSVPNTQPSSSARTPRPTCIAISITRRGASPPSLTSADGFARPLHAAID